MALGERARAITDDVDPDTTITTRRGNTVDIRWVMLGQIQEYARHNGHVDILRELIDGTSGEGPLRMPPHDPWSVAGTAQSGEADGSGGI